MSLSFETFAYAICIFFFKQHHHWVQTEHCPVTLAIFYAGRREKLHNMSISTDVKSLCTDSMTNLWHRGLVEIQLEFFDQGVEVTSVEADDILHHPVLQLSETHRHQLTWGFHFLGWIFKWIQQKCQTHQHRRVSSNHFFEGKHGTFIFCVAFSNEYSKNIKNINIAELSQTAFCPRTNFSQSALVNFQNQVP